MNVYDCKVDHKGRLMLPKQIRGRFMAGVRLVDDDSGKMTIEPLEGDVFIKTRMNLDELLEIAWRNDVTIRQTDGLIQVKGRNVEKFIKEVSKMNSG